MKNYYSILEIDKNAGETNIKKAYRRLAMQYHPDRNPNDPSAGDKFKEITEAYGVLMDPVKRREYDEIFEYTQADRDHAGPQFRYNQEEIFRDLFNNPTLYNFFNELEREFGKSGIRFGPSLLENLLFRQGGIFFAGAVFTSFSPLGKAQKLYKFFQLAQSAHSAYKKYQQFEGDQPNEFQGKKSGKSGFLKEKIKSLFAKKEIQAEPPEDLCFNLRISPKEAAEGIEKPMAFQVSGQEERLMVKIPKGTQNGTKLRLKGKGVKTSEGRGDLYLLIEVG